MYTFYSFIIKCIYLYCMVSICWYLGIRVPSVPSLRSSALIRPEQKAGSGAGTAPQPTASSAKKKAKGRPHTKSQGQIWSRPDLGSGLATWQVCSHQKHTKSLAQTAFEPTSNERCGWVKAHVAPLPARLLCCTYRVSVGASRQDNTE
jgi:hypothetical protein